MSIYEQLRDYCDCVEFGDNAEQNIDELIHLISNATCWAGDGTCSTFLLGERKEVVELPPHPDKCFVFEYKPFYKPFMADSFTLTLITIDGINETKTILTDKDYSYSEAEGLFRIKLPYSCDCKCVCGCEKTYKLLAEYDAGYEEIPECLLPIFCEMLDLINKKNDCDCSCSHCGNDNPDNKTDYGDYTVGDALTNAIINDIGPMLTKQYTRQLGLISLCRNYDMWGVVV